MREKNDLKENTVRGTIFGALERFSVMGIQIICTWEYDCGFRIWSSFGTRKRSF